MKKLFSLLVVGLFLLAYACGGGGNDPKSVMKDYFDVMEGFVNGMEKAGNANDVVAVMEKFVVKMKDLKPRMKAVEEKHPELKKMGMDGKFPEAFKEFEGRFNELMPKMMGSFAKVAQYASDPKVVEVQKKLEEIMKD
jgi:hypothetical protein